MGSQDALEEIACVGLVLDQQDVHAAQDGEVGLGNVGRNFLELIPSQADLLASRYDIELLVVAAADSGGAAVAQAGLDVETVIAAKDNNDTAFRSETAELLCSITLSY